jgi:hypothetical protein
MVVHSCHVSGAPLFSGHIFLSIPIMSSGANAVEINDIQEDEIARLSHQIRQNVTLHSYIGMRREALNGGFRY